MVEQLFKDILETQSVSGDVSRMTKLIAKYAKSFGASVEVNGGNVYVVKGRPTPNGYPCIVSHTDTVHDIIPDAHYSVGYDEKNRIIYAYDYSKRNFTGIGGDDKVGIYIALAAIRDFPSMKACFFRDEEIGCIGSGLAELSFFSDCMYILQCDRRGNSDFVNSIGGVDISSKEFQDDVEPIIKKYKYSFHPGGTTDVGKLTSRKVGVSCANMSCGYHNPHSTDEIVDVDDVNDTKDMVYEIFSKLTRKYPHTAKESVSYGKTYRSKGWDDHWYGGYDNTYVPVVYKVDDDKNDVVEHSNLDWYTDIPSADDIAAMDYDDLYCHAILLMNGWKYCGNMIYSKTEGTSTLYEELHKIDVVSIDRLTEESVVEEALEFAEYLMEYKYSEDAQSKYSCCNCGKPSNFKELDDNYGMCNDCFTKMNAPVY